MSKPIHICILTSAHPVDDVRVSHKIAQAFRAAGFRVTWVGPENTFFDAQHYDRYGVEYRLFPPGRGKLGRLLGYYQAYRGGMQVRDVQVYYAPDPDSAAAAVELAKKGRARVIFDIHEIYHDAMLGRWVKGLPGKLAGQFLLRGITRTCANCDLVVGVSRAVLEPYREAKTEKMVVRSCAPAWFAQRPPAAVCGVGREHFTFMHGKANLARGTHVVLEAMNLARQKNPAIQCMMMDSFVGTTGSVEKEDFFKRVEDLKIHEYIDLHAGVPMQEMPQILLGCDAGLIAYGRKLGKESLPNKLFEYMAAGLPVVAPSYSPEICRILDAEKCGISADFEDPASVAEAMVRLSQNPQESREMGHRAREAFEKRHNWEVEVKPLINLIQGWYPE